MWDGPRQPVPGFRAGPGESFPPRIPPGAHPRMRGRPPFPFRDGPRVSNPRFGGPGVPPFMHRDRDMAMDGSWEEGRMLPEEQLQLSRRARLNMNYNAMTFREGEGTNINYGEMGGQESEFRARLAPDMDYRERKATILDQRGIPDVDYRHEEGPAIAYRERLPPPPIFREREGFEYRRRLLAEMELREREALEQQRQRISTAMNYAEKEMEEMEYKRRLNALQEIVLRQRESSELMCRDRQSTDMLLREREKMLREKSALDYRERGIPAHFRESADLDLRFRNMDQERGLEYRERIVIDYSHNENTGQKCMEKKVQGTEYMLGDYNSSVSLQSDPNLETDSITCRDLESSGESDAAYKKRKVELTGTNSDTDYRAKESADSDYRGKETSDSDYRGRDNTNSDYRDMEVVESYYQDKESADSDYRERKSADADYRNSSENTFKKTADTVDNPSKPLKNQKELKSVMEAPDLVSKSLSRMDQRIPFLSYDKLQVSSLSNINETLCQKGVLTAAKGGAPSKSNKCTYPGKLDVDFRDLPKQNLNQETKEAGNKVMGYSSVSKELCQSDQDMRNKDNFSKNSTQAGGDQDLRNKDNFSKGSTQAGGDQDMRNKDNFSKGSTQAGGDQDMRNKDNFSKGSTQVGGDQDMRNKDNFSKDSTQAGGDEDFRMDKYMQKKDEDFRAGKDQTSVDSLNQNSVLLDFIRLAAKELKQQQEKGDVKKETAGQTVIRAPEKQSMAKMSNPTTSTLKSRGEHTHSVEFLGRQDTDYRNKDYNDVDLRVGCASKKKSHGELQPGSKDKDYRRSAIPDGATRIIWLDGLPTGGSREEILSALAGASPLSEQGPNLIGYIPGYSFGSVCVEFSLVEEAVGCMEANKGIIHFKGKKVNLKYIPNSNRWNCQQCKVVNVLSKERCWQCSALRAGSDHLLLRDTLKDAKATPFPTSRRARKRKAKQSSTTLSPDRKKRNPLPKTNKGGKSAESESATVIIRGIRVKTTPESVVKALRPYVQLSVRNVRIMKNCKHDYRGFGFIDLKNHKEAIRLTVLMRELKPPLTIGGKPISVDIAVGERKNEQRKLQKNRKRKLRRRSYATVDRGPSYVYDPKTGMYVDPLTNAYYSDNKAQRKKDDTSYQVPGSERKEPSSQPRRGFTEDKDSEEDQFKRPLPPSVTKKEETPPEPKDNPLIKLLGEYGEDSDEEEEEEQLLPPIKKKPAPPPPPVIAPKPSLKPSPKPTVPTSSTFGTHEENLTDWKKMICLLCRRQFTSKDILIRHQKLSDLHKQNLAIQEKIKKSRKELTYLQQKEHEENQSIQRRLQQARKELEMLEREEECAQQERKGLDSDVRGPGKKKSKGSDTCSEHKPKVKSVCGQRPAGESYRENMKRLILERYKELE
ncbi:RNA-binding protein 6-like isoform X2 [Hyla sarda]|nr:RNA-binding protein 6-like isoform X2 [Hyla sarda]XP_056381178.1 RNA-binding protein 6-like isoform X2 [Hyla sarda]